MARLPHKITVELFTDPSQQPLRQQIASATTADETQRKSLWAQAVPLQYVVTRRYFAGDGGEQEVKVTIHLNEAIDSYNRLG